MTTHSPIQTGRELTEPTVRPMAACSAIFRLLVKNQLTRGRAAALIGLAIVGVIVAIVTRGDTDLDAMVSGTRFVNQFGLSLLTPVVALVFGTGALGDLVDDRSLVYLWLPPVPRWVIALAAWAATLTVSIPFGVVAVIIIAAVTNAGADLLIGVMWASFVALIAYSGIFTLLGLRFKRALVWGLVYLLIWENFIARAGAGTARLSVLSYARSILSAHTGVGLPLADRHLAFAYIVPIAVGLIALVLTARRLGSQDVD